ncbi:MAG: FeoA family protein [Anaerococcus sp.]|nr:FeoA family protein [Anaerococcus sp.]
MTTLKDIDVGQTVRVKKVRGDGPTIRRIMDMGLTKGTKVFVRKFAPLGDPIQLSLRGFELTIRKEDAKNIEVEVIG